MAVGLSKTQIEVLEALVDGTDLRSVVSGLVEVCWLKADHMQTNWQDRSGARRWMRAAKKLDLASTSPAVDDVS